MTAKQFQRHMETNSVAHKSEAHQCIIQENTTHTHIARVPDQNGKSLLYMGGSEKFWFY